MDLDPQTITSMNQFTASDRGTTITTHGIIDTTSDPIRLVEPSEDYSNERFPLAIPLANAPETSDGAYAIVRGTLQENEERIRSYDALTVEIESLDSRKPELADHADITSTGKAYETIDDIISDFSDPIPRRYIIEMAIERGVTRETAKEVLRRMETAGNIYSPDVGRVGGM